MLAALVEDVTRVVALELADNMIGAGSTRHCQCTPHESAHVESGVMQRAAAAVERNRLRKDAQDSLNGLIESLMRRAQQVSGTADASRDVRLPERDSVCMLT